MILPTTVAPTVIALDVILFRKIPQPKIIASVFVVCMGIAVATVTDTQMVSNVSGMAVGAAATLVTALYQSWAGSKQKELRASSMQLLQAYTPQATLMLGVLVPLCEQMGWSGASRTKDTLLGYPYTWGAIAAIAVSACLGLLVSLSTFLVIGATSSLTYNVVSICGAGNFTSWGMRIGGSRDDTALACYGLMGMRRPMRLAMRTHADGHALISPPEGRPFEDTDHPDGRLPLLRGFNAT